MDNTSFEQQVLDYRNELFASAMRKLRNPADAEDLVQETLMRAIRAESSFRKGSNLRAWLHRILSNSHINHFRRKRRFARIINEQKDALDTQLWAERKDQESAAPGKRLVDASLSDEVEMALKCLRADYRQVVELADLEGQSYRDIADCLGVPMGTVMSRLFRARKQLRERLRGFAQKSYGIGAAPLLTSQ